MTNNTRHLAQGNSVFIVNIWQNCFTGEQPSDVTLENIIWTETDQVTSNQTLTMPDVRKNDTLSYIE